MHRKMWILVLYLTVTISRIYAVDGLSTINDRAGRKLFGGYRITPKFCRASKTLPKSDPRSHGPTICMFNHECTQRQGEVVGACMDGFLFGACCQLHGDFDTQLLNNPGGESQQYLTNSAAALSYESYGNQQNNHLANGGSYNEIKITENGLAHKRPPSNDEHVGNGYDTVVELQSEINDGNSYGNNIYVANFKPSTTTPKPLNSHFYVEKDSVIVTSSSIDHSVTPSSTQLLSSPLPESTKDDIYLPSSHEPNHSPEVPAHIPTGPYESSYDSGEGFIVEELNTDLADKITSQSLNFTHSDISHPGVDAVLLESTTNENSEYGANLIPSSSTERASGEILSTIRPSTKVTYAKPGFRPKPKPTQPVKQSSDQDFVLVQTITNEKKPNVQDPPAKSPESISENNIESIESIILMLNDTKTGPQYNADSVTDSPDLEYSDTTHYSSATQAYTTQNPIDYEKYGQNSYFITTKLPETTQNLPENNYIYSPRPSPIPQPIGNEQHYTQPAFSNGYGPSEPEIIVNKIASTSSPLAQEIASYDNKNHHHSSTTIKYPTTHFHLFKRPSTSATTTTTKKTTTNKKTKKPLTKTTKKPPSTSYVTGQSTVRPQTTVIANPTLHVQDDVGPQKAPSQYQNPQITPGNVVLLGSTYGDFSSTTQSILPEHIIQSQPINQHPSGSGYVQNGIVPSPTVHITPKPTVNLVTSGISGQKPTSLANKYTVTVKQPGTYGYTPVEIYRPVIPSSTPGYIQSYGPSVTYSTPSSYEAASPVIQNDYQQNGLTYYGQLVTKRPIPIQHAVLTPAYVSHPQNVYSSPLPYPPYVSSTSSPFANSVLIQENPVEHVPIGEDDYASSPNDMINFPPVRNPNLNISGSHGAGAITMEDYEISTPNFVEDEQLNDKVGMLVNKIVESLQDNFEDLADIVYKDNKNASTSGTNQKPNVTGKPVTTRRPVPKLTTKRPILRPAASNGITNFKPPPTFQSGTSKPIIPAIGKPTIRPLQTASKKPANNKVPVSTTKKPLNTKRTTKKPATQQQPITTKKPVIKLSTTRKPTAKPSKKHPITTTIAPLSDDSENENEEEIEEDEDNEVGEETYDQTTLAFGEGRIQCGVRPQIKSGRIVGGKAAQFGEFPWQVLVRESTWLGLFTKNKCGGVLISKNYVITAAHCQPGFIASLVAVFGEFDISGDLESKRSVTKNVKRVVVHREYDAATFENDLALLELESPIHYDTHIVPICLPPDSVDFTGRMATVTGWGRLKYGGGVPSVLQEVQVPIIENGVCQEMFHTAGHNKKILPSFLCAGYANGQKDSCEGDSGGPLVLQRSDGRWELAGTVSHGIKCAAPYLPGVYMRTTYYKPWLQSVTGIH